MSEIITMKLMIYGFGVLLDVPIDQNCVCTTSNIANFCLVNKQVDSVSSKEHFVITLRDKSSPPGLVSDQVSVQCIKDKEK